MIILLMNNIIGLQILKYNLFREGIELAALENIELGSFFIKKKCFNRTSFEIKRL
jgi:hypothetical protein